MAAPSIFASPFTGTAGTTVQLSTSGTLLSQSVPPSVYWYLQSAPAASALPTLDQYAILDAYRTGASAYYLGPLAPGTQRADIRLKTNTGGATFTPDAPGQYVIRAYDVTQYRFVPRFGGNVPNSAALEVASDDNETYTLAVYTGLNGAGTAQSYTFSYWVSETHSRKIGFAADNATLTVRMVNAGADASNPGSSSVTLAKPSTPAATIATQDPIVKNIVAYVSQLNANLASDIRLAWSVVLTTAAAFDVHLGLSAWNVHTTTDTTNVLASVALVTDLPTSIVRLADIATKYNAHRVLIGGVPATHPVADVTNVFAPSTLVTLSDALTYYTNLRRIMTSHATQIAWHDQTIKNTPVDGYWGDILEATTDLPGLVAGVNDLTSLYENHRLLQSPKAHADTGIAVDASNFVAYKGATLPALIDLVNNFADALNKHIQNQDKNGAAAATPYHYTTAPFSRLVTTRANDAKSAVVTAEECFLAFYDHVFATGAPPVTGALAVGTYQHKSRAWGAHGYYPAIGASAYPAIVRLQKRFSDFTNTAVPVPPPFVNPVANELVAAYGWT